MDSILRRGHDAPCTTDPPTAKRLDPYHRCPRRLGLDLTQSKHLCGCRVAGSSKRHHNWGRGGTACACTFTIVFARCFIQHRQASFNCDAQGMVAAVQRAMSATHSRR